MRPLKPGPSDIVSILTAVRLNMGRSPLSPSTPGGAGQIGPQGPPGPKGVTWKGLWAAQTNYEVGDIVHHPTADLQRVTYLALVDHTSLAGAPPAPGGTTEWWEFGEAYLLLDGLRPMTGDLDMGDNQIFNIWNLLMSGGVGNAQLASVRLAGFTGADADAEGRITGLERIIFNGTPPASIIEDPTAVQFNPAVTPGTDTTHQEGQVAWSVVEGQLQAELLASQRATLGWVILRCIAAEEGAIGALKVVFSVSIADVYPRVEMFSSAGWAAPATLPPFGLTMHTADGTIWVMRRGYLRVDTSAWAAGDVLWADGTSGGLTTAPAYDDVAPRVCVGRVIVSNAAGLLDVDVRAYPPHEMLTGRSVADSHPASAITNTPSGSLEATEVQAAIDELEAQKVGRRWSYMTKGF